MLVYLEEKVVWFTKYNTFKISRGVTSLSIYMYKSESMKKCIYLISKSHEGYGVAINKRQLNKVASESFDLPDMYEIKNYNELSDIYYNGLNKVIPRDIPYREYEQFLKDIAYKKLSEINLLEKKNKSVRDLESKLRQVVWG